MKLVLAEMLSVAMSLSKVIGANQRGTGYMEGNGYLGSWCVGHLVELSQPEAYDEKYTRLRRTYLMNHRSVLYNTMLLNGSLYPHLMEVKQTAENAAIEAESEKPSAFVILRMKSTGCCGQALILRVEKS